MIDKKQSVKPLLRSWATLFMHKLIFGHKKTGENGECNIDLQKKRGKRDEQDEGKTS
jgi:hypothetical protein